MLARTIFLTLTLLIFCTLMRLCMVSAYLPQSIWSHSLDDFLAMWFMGFKLDMRSISIAMLGYLALCYIMAFISVLMKLFTQNGGKNSAFLRSFLTNTYVFLLGFIFMLMAIVNFYYFGTYGNKIDAFIFGLKNDDTMAILQILWDDYPVFIGLIISIAFGLLSLFIHRITPPFSPSNILINIFLHTLLILSLIVGARGSLGTFPIREDNHFISPIPIFNHLATNPIIAFGWAYSSYKADTAFTPPNHSKGEALQNELFPIFRQTPTSEFLAHNPPHIVINLMESFGGNMLFYDDVSSNDLLGSLRPHFETDFVFRRFLSGGDGTAISFASLFFESPTPNISLGTSKNISLPYNPFRIYADSGYEVIYITSGYASWQGLGNFISLQGAHSIYDALTLMKEFPESIKDKNTYGVPDEYAYKLAFQFLSHATRPTFIAILTTSNHPPFHIPSTYTPKPISPPQALQAKANKNSLDKIILFSTLYQYANDAFGQFIHKVKASPLGENTIIIASGDHKVRDLQNDPSTDKALSHSVPLYLYVPESYQQHIHYDPNRVGSHKDILPTLYELSLSDTTYMNLGGRNILATQDDGRYSFGWNNAVWIDQEGIYPIPGNQGYIWAQDLLQSTDTPIFLSPQKASFASKYQELWYYAISSRVFQGKINQNKGLK